MLSKLGIEVNVVDRDHPRPNLRVSILMGIRLGLLDAHRENLVSLVSLFLLSRHADAFIGCKFPSRTKIMHIASYVHYLSMSSCHEVKYHHDKMRMVCSVFIWVQQAGDGTCAGQPQATTAASFAGCFFHIVNLAM
jgi:hypothetical protein